MKGYDFNKEPLEWHKSFYNNWQLLWASEIYIIWHMPWYFAKETAKCIKQNRENLRSNNLFTELFYAILLC